MSDKFKIGDIVRNKYSGAKGKIVTKRHVGSSVTYVVDYEKYNSDEVYEDVLELVGLEEPKAGKTRSGYDHDEIDQQLEFDFGGINKPFKTSMILNGMRLYGTFDGWSYPLCLENNFFEFSIDFKDSNDLDNFAKQIPAIDSIKDCLVSVPSLCRCVDFAGSSISGYGVRRKECRVCFYIYFQRFVLV
jgi:hypothetical protein